MYEINFNFSIHVDIPDWFNDVTTNLKLPLTWSDYYQGKVINYIEFYRFQQKAKDFPRYRIYTNNNLITERSWVWKPKPVCVEESIWLRIDDPQTIELKIDGVDIYPCKSLFRIENLKVDGWESQIDVDEIASNKLNIALR